MTTKAKGETSEQPASVADVWRDKDGNEILSNLLDTAKALGITKPTLMTWLDQECPCRERGGNGKPYKFFVPDVIEWRSKEDARRAQEQATLDQSILQTKLELDEAANPETAALPANLQRDYYQNQILSNKVRRERGELVEVSRIYDEFEKTFSYVAQNLQSLPDLLARRLGLKPAQVGEMSAIIDGWQEELAKNLHKLQLDLNGNADEGET